MTSRDIKVFYEYDAVGDFAALIALIKCGGGSLVRFINDVCDLEPKQWEATAERIASATSLSKQESYAAVRIFYWLVTMVIAEQSVSEILTNIGLDVHLTCDSVNYLNTEINKVFERFPSLGGYCD